jgi:hypothetical protein
MLDQGADYVLIGPRRHPAPRLPGPLARPGLHARATAVSVAWLENEGLGPGS